MIRLDLTWPPFVQRAFTYFSLANFNVGVVLQPECAVSGDTSVSGAEIWAVKVALPVMFAAVFGVTWGIVRVSRTRLVSDGSGGGVSRGRGRRCFT